MYSELVTDPEGSGAILMQRSEGLDESYLFVPADLETYHATVQQQLLDGLSFETYDEMLEAFAGTLESEY